MDFIDPLYIILPLISATVVGCVCWFIARNRSFKKGYNTRKVEAEAIFGSAEAEGKRIVSEAVKEGEAEDYVIRLYNPKDEAVGFSVKIGNTSTCDAAEKRAIVTVGYTDGKFTVYKDKTPV